MSNKPCSHEDLASNSAGKISMCHECGVVHLHMQNLSLRLNIEQFAELSALAAEAAKKIGKTSKTTILPAANTRH
ncbi:hypothetical protein [Candidatus Methylomicrobium oryzae]|uniref:hypothetical protein n=1 Tax=Candidatus Methylomicrobium oryzae TaxID=2802053 RepID=UPI001922B289|nr:hypothetical protein [Methylomicrobium sp. RS1]MBL1265179.1 hypothetical protein [Methylomicrobium sp. RS1]